MAGAEKGRRLGERVRGAGIGDAEQLRERAPAGLVSGPSRLKTVRTPKSRAHRAGMAHRRMIQRREHEGHARRRQRVRHLGRAKLDVNPQRLKHVGAAAGGR